MDLADKVAVVTGASSGLGRHFSEELTERGAHVYGLARSTDTLETLREELGPAFHPVTCDLRDEEQVQEAFATLREESDRIDILINNAGLARFNPVDELPLEDWDVQIDTNLRGAFLCTREVVPVMKQQNEASGFGGHIINIASIAGLVGNPTMEAYNASKFGLRGFSKALMQEVRADGIKVSCVYPGSIETSFGRGGASNPMQPEDVTRTIMHLLEMPDNYLISEVVMRPLRPSG